MQQIVSITKQGQLTIPKTLLKELGIKTSTKAVIIRRGNIVEVHPKKDFWSLGESLKSEVKLTNEELRKAREEFSKSWAQR